MNNNLPMVVQDFTIRRLTVYDLPEFQAYRHSEELGRYQGWEVQSDNDAVAFLEEMSTISFIQPGEWTQVGIARRDNDKLVGDIGILLAENGMSAEFGITLSLQYQGKGIAVACLRKVISLLFDEFCLESITAVADSRNLPSIMLLDRLKMFQQSSEQVMFRGEPCTEITYCLFNESFDKALRET